MDEDPVEIGVAMPPPGILFPSEFAVDSMEESSSESRLDLEPYIEAVKLNPHSYDAHFALVHAAIELNFSTAVIRAAYENFSKAFPLSPELWKEWIEKEQSEVSLNIQYLRSLFESAFSDYQCASLWIQYLKWLEEKCTDEILSESEVREAHEKALTAVGIHIKIGPEIWNICRAFEEDEAEDLQETGASEDEVNEAYGRVLSLLNRQLSVPLPGNESILERAIELTSMRFKNHDSDDFKKEQHRLESLHRRSQEQLNQRLEFEMHIENALKSADPSQIQECWLNYAEFERATQKDPIRARFTFERALSEGGCCLYDMVWKSYADLLLYDLKEKVQERVVMQRACRNIPWSSDLWCRLFRSEERCIGDAVTSLNQVMVILADQALPSTFADPQQDHLKLLMAGCDAARRAVVSANSTADSLEKEHASQAMALRTDAVKRMREAFVEALGFIEHKYPSWEDGWLALFRYKIETETSIVEPLTECTRLKCQAIQDWEVAIKRWRTSANVWLSYAAWYKAQPNGQSECRKTLFKAIGILKDDAFEMACNAAYEFESQTCKNLDQWDEISSKIRKRRVDMSANSSSSFRSNRSAPYVEQQAGPRKKQQKNNNKRQRDQSQICTSEAHSEIADEIVSPKRHRKRGKEAAEDWEKATYIGRRAAAELAQAAKELKLKAEQAMLPPPRALQVHHQAHLKGTKETVTKHDEAAPLLKAMSKIEVSASNLRTIDTPKFGIPSDKPLEVECQSVPPKALVSEKVQGPISIPVGKSLEVKTPQAAPKMEVIGKTLHSPTYPIEHDCAVVVSNLPFSVNKDELEKLLIKCGSIRSTEFVTNNRGHSKGMATVVFDTQQGAEAAVALHEKAVVKGREMRVSVVTRPTEGSPKVPPIPPAKSVTAHPDTAQTQDPSSSAAYREGLERTIHLSNLPENANEQDLKTFFSTCGPVKALKFLLGKITKEKNGTALVEFEDVRAVPLALLKSGQGLNNQSGVDGKGVLITRSRFPVLESRKKNKEVKKTMKANKTLGRGKGKGIRGAFQGGRKIEVERTSKPLTNADFKSMLYKEK